MAQLIEKMEGAAGGIVVIDTAVSIGPDFQVGSDDVLDTLMPYWRQAVATTRIGESYPEGTPSLESVLTGSIVLGAIGAGRKIAIKYDLEANDLQIGLLIMHVTIWLAEHRVARRPAIRRPTRTNSRRPVPPKATTDADVAKLAAKVGFEAALAALITTLGGS